MDLRGADGFNLDFGGAGPVDAELAGGGEAEIDDAAFMERPRSLTRTITD